MLTYAYMDFKDYLKSAALEIDQEIENFFQIWVQEVQKISPALLPLAQILQEHCRGGKRLRGALVKLGFGIGKGDNKAILKIAAAVEIFQTAILAHDDIIDQSPIRRGRPTIFMELGGDHYGVSQTICLGDIGFFLAVRLIADSNFPPDKKNQAIKAFTQTVINTGLGQMLDIKGGEALTIHKLKTSYYTIINPLQLGIILAGNLTLLKLRAVKNFGENLGLAFQLQDDILGMFGDEKVLGKSVTSDMEEGKNTLLITYALKKATQEQKKILNQYYGTKVSEKRLEEVKKVFIDTGSLDYSRKQALEYVEKAKKFIPKITSNPKYQKHLLELADFCIERKN